MNSKRNKTIFYVCAPFLRYDYVPAVIGREAILRKLIGKGYRVVIINISALNQHIFDDFSKDCEIHTLNIQNEPILIRSFLYVLHLAIMKKRLFNLPAQMAKEYSEILAWPQTFIRKLLINFLNYLSENKLFFLFEKLLLLSKIQKLYKAHLPILTVFYGYMSTLGEMIVVSAAKNARSKTVGIPDAFTAFVHIPYYSKTDLTLVWDELMKKQAIEWHGCKDSSVKPIGILKVDAYKISNKKLQSRDEFIQSNGLAKGRKIISVVGGNISLFEASRILTLTSFCGEMQEKIQILYRSRQDQFELDQKCLGSLRDEYLFLIKGFSSEPNENEIQWQLLNIANFLKNSDIVLLRASAMAVEALYFGAPSIFLMYGQEKDMRWYKQDHIAMLLKRGIIKEAKNDLELINAIKYYLDNPVLDIHMRANYFGKYYYSPNEDSIERCYKEINNFLNEKIL